MMYSTLETFGEAIAIIDEAGSTYSYAELAARSDAAVKVLGPRKQLVAIECENTPEVLFAYIGALRSGHAVILTGPEGADASSAITTQFRPNFIFRRNQEGNFHFAPESSAHADLHPELAVLLSTSGTTGSAKLVRLSHTNLSANADSIATYLHLTPADRAITCLPMQYSYGLSVINSHLSCGASLILTGKSITDPSFWGLFDRHEATNFQGVPHSFQLLHHSDFRNRAHPSLRFFTQAGGKLPQTLVTAFGEYAQSTGTRFYVMYGQTEATARMAWLPPEDTLKHPDVIGQAIPGGAFSIENDGIAAGDGETGELVYRGPNVMMGYALTRSDFALGKTTHELRTGDIAMRSPVGYYKITGRASRFLKIFGLRIGLDEVEDRLRTLGVTAAATGTDERLIIAIETTDAKAVVNAFVSDTLGLPANACIVVVTLPIPRTYNGKTDYSAIKALADTASDTAPSGSLSDEARTLFQKTDIDTTKSFIELGGDSLSYVHFALAIERRLGHLPANWEHIPLNTLEKMASPAQAKRKDVRNVPTDFILRAVAILLVIFHHVTELNMEGAAALLLALAGYNFGRFQVPKIIDNKGMSVIQTLILKVLIPYFIILIPIALLTKDFLPNFLLIYNFISDHERWNELPYELSYYWYIEAYIKIIAVLTALLSLPALQNIAKKNPWVIPLVLFIALDFLRYFTEDLGDRGIFNPTSSVVVGSRFAAGWLIFSAPAGKWRWMAAAFVIACIYFNPLIGFEAAPYIISGGLAALALVASVPISGAAARFVVPLVTIIATSSLYIYMMQFYVINFAANIQTPMSIPLQVITGVACVAVGIATQWTIDRISEYWAKRRSTLAQTRSAAEA